MHCPRQERKAKRSFISQDLVSQWWQGRSNHHTSFDEVCADESSMVGKNTNGSCVESHTIRDVGLDATGRLDQTTLNLAAKLKLPHHVGAGGEEDFTDKEAFQKHVRRVSNRNKKKR